MCFSNFRNYKLTTLIDIIHKGQAKTRQHQQLQLRPLDHNLHQYQSKRRASVRIHCDALQSFRAPLKLPELPLSSGGCSRVAASTGHLERDHAAEGASTTGVDQLHEANIRLAAYGATAGGASRNLDRDRLVEGNVKVSGSVESLLGKQKGDSDRAVLTKSWSTFKARL